MSCARSTVVLLPVPNAAPVQFPYAPAIRVAIPASRLAKPYSFILQNVIIMKKKTITKLSLKKATVCNMAVNELRQINGGAVTRTKCGTCVVSLCPCVTTGTNTNLAVC
jgi:hypothetical protein